ncbi:MAG: hypothetical protein MUC87_13925 [Bacteroidia bacterium]|jgi:hypothetical protein|nr:hypothetical protein [Bacteroidia bacterium]
MKRYFSLFTIAGVFTLFCSVALTGDTETIEGKAYKVTMTEAKKGGKSGKPEADVVSIKNGKFRSKLIGRDMGADAINIELTVDSVYKDEGEEVIYVEFEGTATNKLDETVEVKGTIDGYGIEGSAEVSKKGKVKRHYDFVGSEKEGKKK